MKPEIWSEKWSMIGIVVSPGGKCSWVGEKKRDYVDPKGNRYTVLGKWIAGQYLYQISKTRKSKWRKMVGWPYFQSEQEAQAHLDVFADDDDSELFLDREFDHYKLENKKGVNHMRSESGEANAMAIDYATKTGILAALTDIFQGADYPIQLELSKDGNQVIVHYNNGMPDDRANIRGDNHMAMLYDLFKQCGPHMMAKI